MQRRTYLSLTTAALIPLAGCAGDSEEVDGGTREEDNGSDSGTEDDSESSSDSTDGENNEGTPQLEIVDHELIIDEGEFSTDAWVEATVENSGDAASGSIELQADWYDSGGDYLDNSNARLNSLGEGETWIARIYHLGSGAEDIDDYEVEGDFDTEAPSVNPDGLELLESELESNEDEVTITGRIENQRDEDIDYVEVIAKVYAGDGNVLGDEWTNVTDLRAGDTWSFNMNWLDRRRADQAADHDIVFKDSVW